MNELQIGSLCSGYGGLDQAVQAVIGGQVAWVSDIDKGASKILAHRHPDAPNLGDFTKADWSKVPAIEVLCAGFPCQPVSNAGKRAGVTDERWLFDDICDAISNMVTRPRLLVFENVLGLLSANGGDAMARVVQGLAQVGYVGRYGVLRAADVGAPHGRKRVFIAAYDNSEGRGGIGWQYSLGRDADGCGGSNRLRPAGQSSALLPTPVSGDADRGSLTYDRGNPTLIGALLPTPAVNDMGEGKTVEAWDQWTATMQTKHGNGNGHGKSLSIEAQRLLPTPRAARGASGTETMYAFGAERTDEHRPQGEVALTFTDWGMYADAIARWETLTRPAPAPTMLSKKGTPQLSPAFSEWMMGLPVGWVTDVPDITRNEALRALGNGVVPQQAEAALRFLLSVQAVAA